MRMVGSSPPSGCGVIVGGYDGRDGVGGGSGVDTVL